MNQDAGNDSQDFEESKNLPESPAPKQPKQSRATEFRNQIQCTDESSYEESDDDFSDGLSCIEEMP